MVSLCCFPIEFVAAVVSFFIAGLLFLLCLTARRLLGSVQHPIGDRTFSSHLLSIIDFVGEWNGGAPSSGNILSITNIKAP